MAEKKKSNKLVLAVIIAFFVVAIIYAYLYYDKKMNSSSNQNVDVDVNIKKINTNNLDTSIFKDTDFVDLKKDNFPKLKETAPGNSKPFLEQKK